MVYDASLMIDQLMLAGERECVAYGVETREEMNRVVFPLLLGEIRQRRISVSITYDRITNEKGGYLFLFAWREPSWEQHLRGRQIIAGNVPDEYIRRYS